ncbi:hypothetical protein GCM10011578_018930 [Streptomyces fuscichromogenes]|uniref:Uncharacterized protein n=1 Tax=Streptomyces fuscichromogenes TaxID=1324013 RepID=A0A917X9R2_9ACTN|nr:hypothetical protein GCM10011578_018930 [Streptomyces fuscichromogenes]
MSLDPRPTATRRIVGEPPEPASFTGEVIFASPVEGGDRERSRAAGRPRAVSAVDVAVDVIGI